MKILSLYRLFSYIVRSKEYISHLSNSSFEHFSLNGQACSVVDHSTPILFEGHPYMDAWMV